MPATPRLRALVKILGAAAGFAFLLGAGSCREVPGCVDTEGHLCLRIAFDARLAQPDQLRVEGQAGATGLTRTLRDNVAAAFADHRPYFLDLDLTPVRAVPTVSLDVFAEARGGVLGSGSYTHSANGPRSADLVLRPVGGGDDGGGPDLQGVDLRGADLTPAKDWIRTPTTLGLSGSVSLSGPTDVCWNGRILYISDTLNHRVLAYDGISGTNPPKVIGRANLTQVGNPAPAVSQQTLNEPRGLWCDANSLLVADDRNNRVLFFENYSNPGMPANFKDNPLATSVVGQANFTVGSANRGGTTSADGLSRPSAVFWDVTRGDALPKRLYIADRSNNRVVGYDAPNASALKSLNLASGAVFFGQMNGTSGGNGTSLTALAFPTGVWVNGTKVGVTDAGNNRVASFAIPQSGATPPYSLVGLLGQESPTASGRATTRRGLSNPVFTRVFSGEIFVSDNSNHRVLIYTPDLPGMNTFGLDATDVLGQDNFTQGAAGTLNGPGGFDVASTGNFFNLILADTNNNRVLVFRRPL